MTTATDLGGTRTVAFDGSGMPASVTHGATQRAYTYDPFGRLGADTLTTNTGAQLARSTYGYDAASNVTTKTETVGSNTGNGVNAYTYDSALRLRSWNRNGTTTGYDYDPSGNRVKAGTATYTFDARNRILTGPGESYTVVTRNDEHGNDGFGDSDV